jgi:hypothetical protein
MKKLTKSVLAILVVASSFTACKKGEGDPALSFRSRAARVAGEWKVSNEEGKSDYSNSSTGSAGSTGSMSYKFTPTNYTATSVSGANTSNSTGTVTENSWTFEKTGTFTHKKNYTVKSTETETQFGVTSTVEKTTVYSISEEGVWNFLGSVQDDTKNKEEMSVSVTKTNNVTTATTVTTVTYPGFSPEISTRVDTDTETSTDEPNSNVSVWKITTLKNKEMVVEAAGKSTNNYTSTSVTTSSAGTNSSSYSSTGTSSSSSTISLEQD